MPVNTVMPKEPKSSGVTMIASAALTLIALSVLAFADPSIMLLAAGAAFVALALRFVWLVWHELK